MRRFTTPLFLAASVIALSACQPEAETDAGTEMPTEATPAEMSGSDQAPAPETPAPVIEATSDTWLSGVDLAAYLDCAREDGATFLQAHRSGDRPGAAENSLKAIEASLADGAVFAEMDVFRTADGALVLMHDRTVDRTTTGTGDITEMTYAQVSALELVDVDGAPTGERVPTLEAALEFLDGRGIAQVDLKNPSLEEISAALEAGDAVDRSVVITYSMEDALALHERLPGVMVSVGINDLEDLAALREAGADLSRFTAWLGVGTGNPELDALLADAGLETSYGDFSGERDGSVDYTMLASNGAEVISVDDVPAAAAALNAAETARTVLAACEAARP